MSNSNPLRAASFALRPSALVVKTEQFESSASNEAVAANNTYTFAPLNEAPKLVSSSSVTVVENSTVTTNGTSKVHHASTNGDDTEPTTTSTTTEAADTGPGRDVNDSDSSSGFVFGQNLERELITNLTS